MRIILSLVGDGLGCIGLVTDNVHIIHGICVPYKYAYLGCVVHITWVFFVCLK